MTGADIFAGIPAPVSGRLVVYVFGPGIGECQVVSLPDGKWMVVDCCKLGEITLPLALLRHFGVSTVDLLVVTHPDRDHYRGLDELIGGVHVEHLWRYRGFHMRREALAELCAQQPENRRFGDLLLAQDAMRPLLETNRGFEVAIDTMPWTSGGPSSYEVIWRCSDGIGTSAIRIGSRAEDGHGHGHGHGSEQIRIVAVAVAVADPP